MLYSDECFQSILQIRSNQKDTEALTSDREKRPDTESQGLDSEYETDDDSRQQNSSDELAIVAAATPSGHPIESGYGRSKEEDEGI